MRASPEHTFRPSEDADRTSATNRLGYHTYQQLGPDALFRKRGRAPHDPLLPGAGP